MNEGEMVAPALKRSVWDRCQGRRFVVNRPRACMHETALVGGWWMGGDKDKGGCVSGVVDRNVWGCGSMGLPVGVAWVM